MIRIGYAPEFFRALKKLPKNIQEKTFACIKLFEDRKNHRALEVHKLHGIYKGTLSFSVDFRYRIIFAWVSKHEVEFYTIGDHNIYRNKK